MSNSSNTAAPEYGFVYIHGAGLGTWIWEEVTKAIDVPSLSVSFPGRDGSLADRGKLGLREYSNHVSKQVDEWPVEHVIVVSHSIGGLIGLEVASNMPDRVVGFVGICAAIPRPGGSFLSCYPFHKRIAWQTITRLAGTKPPDSAIRRSLCTELSEEQAKRVIEQFTPESRRLFLDRCKAVVPDVPSLYVKTENDNEFGSSLQDTMIANLKADEVLTIDAGHMPMLSNPQKLVEILGDFRNGVSEERKL